MCTEALSSLFQVAEQNGRFPRVAVCRGGPRISHLFFADDSVIFGDASFSRAAEVRRILNVYEVASGQKINLEKSVVFFS